MSALHLLLCAALFSTAAAAFGFSRGKDALTRPQSVNADGAAEARLVQIYRLVGSGNIRKALRQAHSLAGNFPHFQLAQLVYADLPLAQGGPLRRLRDVPDGRS